MITLHDAQMNPHSLKTSNPRKGTETHPATILSALTPLSLKTSNPRKGTET